MLRFEVTIEPNTRLETKTKLLSLALRGDEAVPHHQIDLLLEKTLALSLMGVLHKVFYQLILSVCL